MKINFFSDFCFPGGIPVHQGELALHLSKMYGHENRLCIPWPLKYDMNSNKEYIENAYNHKTLNNVFAALDFLEYIENESQLEKIVNDADINHFHGSFSTNRDFLGKAIKYSKNSKINFYTFHSESVNPNCESNIEELKNRISKIDNICAVSERVKASVAKIFPESNIYITPNGINRSIYNVENDSKCDFSILFVGRLNKTKGIDNVIKLIEDCENKKINFIIAGEAEFDCVYNEKMENLSKKNSRVKWINKPLSRNDIMSLYKQADIFYFPSMMEGGPLVVLEAMSYGNIPVVTDVGCLNEIIINTKNGYIFKQEQYAEQKQAIFKLYKEKKLRYTMRENVLNTKLNLWEETAAYLNELYERKINE